jgi:hypothetical protein
MFLQCGEGIGTERDIVRVGALYLKSGIVRVGALYLKSDTVRVGA